MHHFFTKYGVIPMKIMRLGIMVLCLVLAVALIAGTSLVVASYGSESDPLVTLSYLEDVFGVNLLKKVETLIGQREEALKNKIESALGSGGSATYAVVSLESGQVLKGEVGTEIMLRIGSAVCSADGSPGLIDTTDGSSIDNGSALKTNHLYMVTIEGRGVKATNSVKVIVRGDYTIS